VPSWVDRSLLALGILLMTVCLVSNSGVVKGFTLAAGAGVVAAALTVFLRRRVARGGH
jgi:energy-converting hydrogenase Eha subunit A